MARFRDEIAGLATPLKDAGDLDALLDRVGDARVVMLGEATHGTHGFYGGRAAAPQGCAGGIRSVADLDVGQRGGDGLLPLAAHPQRRAGRTVPGRLPWPGRLFAVGVAGGAPDPPPRPRS